MGLKDLPVYLIQSTSDLVLLPINLVIITLSWAFSKSIIINIWGFIYFISLIILIFNKKFPSIDFANIIIFYLIGYSFIVSNSGTGMRVFSFAVYVSLGCIYFKKSILQK